MGRRGVLERGRDRREQVTAARCGHVHHVVRDRPRSARARLPPVYCGYTLQYRGSVMTSTAAEIDFLERAKVPVACAKTASSLGVLFMIPDFSKLEPCVAG